MKRLLSVVVLVITIAYCHEAHACQCGRRIAIDKQYSDARIVFIGRVEGVRDRWNVFSKLWLKIRRFFDDNYYPEVNLDHYCSDFGMEVLFTVQKSWKGPTSREVTLLTGRGGGDCGVPFETGKVYLVYAYPRTGDGCQTNICTRTRELAFGGDDLAYLNRLPIQRLR